MTFPVQCPAVYDRILPGDLSPTHIRCTYLEGHQARHSWESLKVVDDAVRITAEPPQVPPADVTRLVRRIENGELDDFVELVLAAGHQRKLARRGVAGFGRQPYLPNVGRTTAS